MEHCRSCNAEIFWAITTKGRRIPLDKEPSPNGNITLQWQGPYMPQLATAHTVRDPKGTYYISHFATCPQAKNWRKK